MGSPPLTAADFTREIRIANQWHEQKRCGNLPVIMDIRKTSNGRQYAWAVRCVAILAALFFTMTSLVAVLHHHGARLSVTHGVALHHDTTEQMDASSPSAPSFNAADCMLCDWLTTAATPAVPIIWAVTAAFSFLSLLLLEVRLAALCSRPAPRRGLRAPPVACVA